MEQLTHRPWPELGGYQDTQTASHNGTGYNNKRCVSRIRRNPLGTWKSQNARHGGGSADLCLPGTTHVPDTKRFLVDFLEEAQLAVAPEAQ